MMHRPSKEEAGEGVQPVTTLKVKTLESISDTAKTQREQQRRVLDDQNSQALY